MAPVIDAVSNNKADFGAIDVASLIYLTQQNNFPDIYKVGDTGFVYEFSFGAPKDMPELRNIHPTSFFGHSNNYNSH
jgi:ABC-type amino acid transport substrate-binding protein